MCIIAYYKKGKTPTLKALQYMMITNSDGAGIAWNDGKEAFYVKGIEKPADAYNFIRELRRDPSVRDIVFHARIATSGGVSGEKCHPFPLTDDPEALNAKEGSTSGAPLVFHNGVFRITPEKGLNDTQTYIKNILTPLYNTNPAAFDGGKFDPVINTTSDGSRVLLLYPDGVKFFGQWYSHEGIKYSNRNYYEKFNFYNGYYYRGCSYCNDYHATRNELTKLYDDCDDREGWW